MLGQQFDNVLDLEASRKVKEKTGQVAAIKKGEPESSDFSRHADQAIGMTQEKKQGALHQAMKFLGFVD